MEDDEQRSEGPQVLAIPEVTTAAGAEQLLPNVAMVPLRVTAILGRFLDLYASNVVPLLILSGIVSVPVLVLTWSLPDVVRWLANGFAGALTGGALTVAFERLHRGQSLPVREIVRVALRHHLRLLAVWFVLGIVLFLVADVFFLLAVFVTPVLAIPGLLLALLLGTRWGLATQAVMLEQTGVSDGFHRSATLVVPAWRTAIPVVAVASLFGLGGAVWGVAAALTLPSDLAVVGALAVASTLLGPVLPGALTLLFLSLRGTTETAAGSIAVVPHQAESSTAFALTRQGLILGAFLSAMLVGGAAWAGLSALGPAQNLAHSGQVRFGATKGVDLCDVGQPAEVFSSGSTLYWSAVLSHSVAKGQHLEIEVARDGVVVDRASYTADSEMNCFGSTEPIGPLPLGAYTYRILNGATVEATGSLTIR